MCIYDVLTFRNTLSAFPTFDKNLISYAQKSPDNLSIIEITNHLYFQLSFLCRS